MPRCRLAIQGFHGRRGQSGDCNPNLNATKACEEPYFTLGRLQRTSKHVAFLLGADRCLRVLSSSSPTAVGTKLHCRICNGLIRVYKGLLRVS